MLQQITLISDMVSNPIKMVGQFFWAASSFPNLGGPKAFSPKFIKPRAPTAER